MRKKLLVLAGCLISILMFATIVSAQTWYDQGWAYRIPIEINNSCGETVTGYQVNVTLDDDSFDFLAANADGSDVRVTADDGVTLIPFWIESWNPSSSPPSASIWVKVPEIENTVPATIYLYYGNPGATSASDGSNTFIFFDSFEDFNTAGMNAPDYLTTPTYDGQGQVVHPDVVYVPGGWNGYAYWMAMTPYPGGNPTTENPSVIASNDGISWEVPSGLTNPLVGGGSKADPDMLLVDGTMILYYIHADSTDTYVERITSTDGTDWTHDASPVITMSRYLLSPTLLYEGETYYMWYVRNAGCTANSSSVYMRTSSDGITWEPEQPVSISLTGQVMWHPDVQKVGDKYIMLVAAYPNTSNCGNTSLYYSESTDKTNWTEPVLILAKSASGWDSGEIYRSSFLAEEIGGDIFLRIWYSADSSSGQWHVGYTEGCLDDFITLPESHWDVINGNVSATTDYARSGDYSLKQVGGRPYPQIYKTMTGKFSVNAWLYDQEDTDPSHLAVLRVQDPDPANHMIGVGFYTGSSTYNYSYHTEGFIYTPTSIPRTTGWHKLTINVKYDTCDLLVDDNWVASLDVLDEDNIINFSLQGYLGGTSWFDDVYARQYCGYEPSVSIGDMVMQVTIDIKPGSYPNSINLGSNGVIPVAILTSASFDATTVNPSTVELGGSGVAVRGKGKSLAHEEDVNGDGLIDLLVQVETENLDPAAFQDGYIILTGNTYDGTPIQGSDEIVIVPNGD